MNIVITLITLTLSVVLIAGGVSLFKGLLIEQPVKISIEVPRLPATKPAFAKGGILGVMLCAVLFGLLISIMLTQVWGSHQTSFSLFNR